MLIFLSDKTGNNEFHLLVNTYARKVERFVPFQISARHTETDFWLLVNKSRERTKPFLIMLDSRGKQLSSEQFAERIGKLRDEGQQTIIFAIGPADGWSEEARKKADLLLSLGPMTLPHELARVVLSEQIYRAFTILSGHPYHTGH